MKVPAVVVVLFFAVSTLFAGGSRIKVTLQDDNEITGELLSVRDNALVIATKEYTEYTVRPSDQSRIAVLKFEDVKVVEAPGSSYTWLGIGVGFVGGLAITGAIMSAEETETTDPLNAYVGFTQAPVVILGGAILGAGIGGGVGSIASTPDVKVIVGPSFDFASLKLHSRYPESEPEVLQAVQYYSSLK